MSTHPELLVVDDEAEIGAILEEYFSEQGYKVVTCANAAMAREIVGHKLPDIAILDINMPGEDGLSLARWLRATHPMLGIIMLTTAAETVDRIIGLEVGADDYVGKPFDPRELLARVRSVLRRLEAKRSPPKAVHARVRFGTCELDLNEHKLRDAAGADIPITAMEFDLLKVFAERPNRVLSRDQLMDLAHQKELDVFDRSIDLRIMRLRRKIECDPEKPEVLKTVRGAGYVFVAA